MTILTTNNKEKNRAYNSFLYGKGVKNIIVHGGIFHADDVFFTALASLVFPKAKVYRLNSEEEMITENINRNVSLIGDVFNGSFDHHTLPDEVHRSNDEYFWSDGTQKAAFGKLWSLVGSLFIKNKEERDRFTEEIVIPLDRNDTSGIAEGKADGLVDAVKSFLPTWEEDTNDTTYYSCFMAAVSFAKNYLQGKIKSINSFAKAKETIDEVVKTVQEANQHYIVLDKFIPLGRINEKNGIAFAIFPSNRGGFVIKAMNSLYEGAYSYCVDRYNYKIGFPSDLYGKTGSEFEKLGFSELTFCHNSGFMAVAKSREAAIQVVERLISNANLSEEEWLHPEMGDVTFTDKKIIYEDWV